jgi:hypothetical protein
MQWIEQSRPGMVARYSSAIRNRKCAQNVALSVQLDISRGSSLNVYSDSNGGEKTV